jgi:hypothetical protein
MTGVIGRLGSTALWRRARNPKGRIGLLTVMQAG